VISFLFVFAYLMSCMHAEIQVTEFGHQSDDLQESYDVFTIGDPVQVGAWVKPPDIYICSGTPITSSKGKQSLELLEKIRI
jgi:hypothetical protein